MSHHHHPAIIQRLKRADGHLRMIIEMIRAGHVIVESAVENAKKSLDHIGYCLDRSLKGLGARGRAALREFKLIAKYL